MSFGTPVALSGFALSGTREGTMEREAPRRPPADAPPSIEPVRTATRNLRRPKTLEQAVRLLQAVQAAAFL